MHGISIIDRDRAGLASKSSVYGAEINTMIAKTSIAVEAARYENELDGSKDTTDEFDVYLSHMLAKGLTVQPEYTYYRHNYATSAISTDTSEVLIRIQRDF